MAGLSIERRAALCDALDRRIRESPRLPDGTLAMIQTVCDGRVYRCLLLDHYNGATGRCDPGYRRLAAGANVALGTVSNATRRLRATGLLSWRRVLRYVHGCLRFCRAYEFAAELPELRSRYAPKPTRELVAPAVAPQGPVRSVARQIAIAAAWDSPEAVEAARRAFAERAARVPAAAPGRGGGPRAG